MKHTDKSSIHKTARFFAAALFILIAGTAAAAACEMTFSLEGSDGTELRLLPGSSVTLNKNTAYTLRTEFTEDHRNCKVPASDTLFLLDDEKWRVNKETQQLVLTSPITWSESSKTQNEAVISFSTRDEGTAVLNVSRSCSKGGYNESFTFTVK